jgi:uncharacterized alkaline shock family protein YloU
MSMRREESRTYLGTIKIHKSVIESISAIAACEIEGVKCVGADFKLFGRRAMPAIKVDIEKNEEVNVDVPLIVRYGFNIPEVSSRVQENVRAALEKMGNLSIGDININVQGIEK